MLNIAFRAEAVEDGAAGAASRYGSGSIKMMQLLAAPASALQHCAVHLST
jgi:hypothetical protein